MQKTVSRWKLSPLSTSRSKSWLCYPSLSVSLCLSPSCRCVTVPHINRTFLMASREPWNANRIMIFKCVCGCSVCVCVCVCRCLQSSADAINTDMHKHILIFLSLSICRSFTHGKLSIKTESYELWPLISWSNSPGSILQSTNIYKGKFVNFFIL